jgi:hypothetical protein
LRHKPLVVGGIVGLFSRFTSLLVLSLVAGCAESQTNSTVSKGDIPAAGYRKIVVFVEGLDGSRSTTPSLQVGNGQITLVIPTGQPVGAAAELEDKLLSALQDAGVSAVSGEALFKGQAISEKAKAGKVQKEFDAVLYVNVLTNGFKEYLVVGASHNGQYIWLNGEVQVIDSDIQAAYELKPDGSVWRSVPTLDAKSDLQDTKSAKQVWSGETHSTGGTLVLASQATKELVQKMHADGVI